jgi:hypothetical protein
MVLVLRLVKKMTILVTFGGEVVEQKRKLSQTVTAGHICLLLGYTIVSILSFNVLNTNGPTNGISVFLFRGMTALAFFGALSDLFLTSMLWFILEEKGAPSIFMDEKNDKTYAVLDVIASHNSSRNSADSSINLEGSQGKSDTTPDQSF